MPSASRNALHRFLTVAAVAQMYLSSFAALISSNTVSKPSIDLALTLHTWSFPPPQEKVAEDAIRGMQRQRDLRQSRNDSLSKFFEQVQFGSGTVSSCAIGCQTLTWLVIVEMLPARQSSKVSVASMLTCPLPPLSISQPAPWAKQTHVITVLFPCPKHAFLSLG